MKYKQTRLILEKERDQQTPVRTAGMCMFITAHCSGMHYGRQSSLLSAKQITHRENCVGTTHTRT